MRRRMLTQEEIERMSDKGRRQAIVDILSNALLEWLKENPPPAKTRKDKPACTEKVAIIWKV